MTKDRRNLTPKERANAYKARYGRQPKIDSEESTGANQKQTAQNHRTPRDMDHWSDIVGQRIEEAMRQGYFDNLSGEGKPLNLNKNPFVPDDMQMANSLMQSNGLTPGWIGERKSVFGAIELFREELTACIVRYVTKRTEAVNETDLANAGEEFERQLETLREQLAGLNKRIEVVNIEQPVQHLEIYKLSFQSELEYSLMEARQAKQESS